MKADVMQVLEKGEPVKTANDVAEDLDCSKKTANKRLNELADEGKIHKKKVGSRAVVYWIPGSLATIPH